MGTAQQVIEKLGLQPLPEEGGYYKETYQSVISLPAQSLGIRGDGPRKVGTAIYYLVVPSSFSALHRLKSDEIFHFYSGDPVEMLQIDSEGLVRTYTLGPDILNGQTPQVVVPAGAWQGLRLKDGGEWALLGTTMSPGFDFSDFELGSRELLVQQFPEYKNKIFQFSRATDESSH